MKSAQLRDMTIEEINAREAELGRELFNLRMRHATNQLENPLKLRTVKKEIARVKTIISEKKRGA